MILCQFLISIDDNSRFTPKLFTEIKEKVLNYDFKISQFEDYLYEIEEIESIIRKFLRNDDQFQEIMLQKEQKLLKNPEDEILSFYENEFYKKFDWKSFNENKIILYKTELPKKEEKIEDSLRKSIKNCKEMSQIASQLKNMLTIPNALQVKQRVKPLTTPIRSNMSRRESVFSCDDNPENTRTKNSLEIHSFFENESTLKDSGLFAGVSFLSLKSLKMQKKKDCRLLGKRYYKEFTNEYKPKVLTTNICKIKFYSMSGPSSNAFFFKYIV